MGVARAALALVAVAAATAHADDARVDWARGLVIARGVGVADRHAPTPAIARSTARRGADDAARRALAATLPNLPLARGGNVQSAAKDPAVATRIADAVAHAITLDADPDTDGAWTVTLAVPIEAVRQAIDGPRALAANAADVGPAIAIVTGATATPAIGYRVGGQAVATVWRRASDLPAAWNSLPHARVTKVEGGALAIDPPIGNAATLYVIVTL